MKFNILAREGSILINNAIVFKFNAIQAGNTEGNTLHKMGERLERGSIAC